MVNREKEIDIIDKITDSYRQYAKELIGNRAFPDLRDGLIPVQRRILFDMYKMGILSNKKHVKSARVVGDVMGKYHPHGDQSLYGSLVNLAIEWGMNVPLVEIKGNKGSIDGDSPASMRYCLTGGSVLHLEDGRTVRMDEVVKDSELNTEYDINIRVKGFNGEGMPATKFFNSGKHEVIEVEMENGDIFRGTRNHPVLALRRLYGTDRVSRLTLPNLVTYRRDDHCEQLYWVLLEDLTVGTELKRLDGKEGTKVKRVELKGEEVVYSIRVDHWSHSFIADGYIHHNTETRLTKEAEYLLRTLNKDTVDWGLNFDDELEEPHYLPAEFPNVLVNGGGNMAVGFSSNNLPHNITESIESCIQVLEDDTITFKDLAIQGPDFPGGGRIINGKELERMYELGTGRVRVRSRYKIEYRTVGKKKERTMVFYEILKGTNKAKVVDDIQKMLADKKLNGVIDVRDETGSDGIRVCVDIDQEVSPELVAEILYKKTELEITVKYESLLVNKGKPKFYVPLVEIIKEFNQVRLETIYRELESKIKEIGIKIGRLDALIKVSPYLEELIQLIKESATNKEAKEGIMAKYELEEYQADYLLSLQLRRLTKDNVEDYIRTKNKLVEEQKECQDKIATEENLKEELKRRYLELKDELHQERRTEIMKQVREIDIKIDDVVKYEETVVGVTSEGKVKRSNKRSYSLSDKREDEYVVETDTHSSIIIFTSYGRYAYLPVPEIKEMRWSEEGQSLLEITNDFGIDEKVIGLVEYDATKKYLSITKGGLIKKGELKDLEVSRYSKQYNYMPVEEDDLVQEVGIIEDDIWVVAEVETKKGEIYALPFNTEQVTLTGKNAKGRRVVGATKTRTFKRLARIEPYTGEELEIGRTTYNDLDYNYTGGTEDCFVAEERKEQLIEDEERSKYLEEIKEEQAEQAEKEEQEEHPEEEVTNNKE